MHSHFEKFKTKIKTLSLLVLAVGGIYVYLINIDITVGFLKYLFKGIAYADFWASLPAILILWVWSGD